MPSSPRDTAPTRTRPYSRTDAFAAAARTPPLPWYRAPPRPGAIPGRPPARAKRKHASGSDEA